MTLRAPPQFDVDADGTLDNNEIAQGLRSVLTERKHHERVRTAAIFLMGVVVAMLGIGAMPGIGIVGGAAPDCCSMFGCCIARGGSRQRDAGRRLPVCARN